jgi:hypothetical protein
MTFKDLPIGTTFLLDGARAHFIKMSDGYEENAINITYGHAIHAAPDYKVIIQQGDLRLVRESEIFKTLFETDWSD